MLDFDAGKYAVFVWPAYGLTAGVLAAMIADSLGRARRWKRRVTARQAAASEGCDRDGDGSQ